MFQRILVPLDGSLRAEQALAVATRLARASAGSLVLVQAVSIPLEYTTYLYSEALAQTPFLAREMLEAQQANARAYLSGIARSQQFQDTKAETFIQTGAAASVILDVARKQHADLIVMCRHGAGGLRRWLLGSVAQKVARHSSPPLLLLSEGVPIPASPSPEPSDSPRRLRGLVALDGSVQAEAALVPSAILIAMLAAPARGELRLVTVVRRPNEQALPGAEPLADAERCLSRVAERLASPTGPLSELDLAVSWSAVVGEDVAETILTMAEEGEVGPPKTAGACDVLAMATLGRGGFQHWIMGSITERILGATRLPLLIARSEGEPSSGDASS